MKVSAYVRVMASTAPPRKLDANLKAMRHKDMPLANEPGFVVKVRHYARPTRASPQSVPIYQIKNRPVLRISIQQFIALFASSGDVSKAAAALLGAL